MEKKKSANGYSLNWEALKGDIPLWFWLAGMLIAATLIYPHLPERVPSHWNFRGEVDAYSSPLFGAFFAPLMSIGLYLLLLVTPLIDPKRENYTRFAEAYRLLRWSFVLFMSALYAVTVLNALGHRIDVGFMVKALTGILFVIIGNFMGEFRHNYFVGIKTPWTLASEEVWQRTHRLGAKVWVAGGLACLLTAPVPGAWGMAIYFAAIAAMVAIPTVYSYILFRRQRSE
ncbi:MAG: SdpI family protein [Thermacetogeniaceae bacterium]